MSLRVRLLLYLLGLHLIFFAFTVVLFRDRPALFITLEVLLLATLFGGLHLMRRALEPLSYTQRFHDLLQDQNYAARLLATPDRELAGLVGLFNSLLEQLYQERLKLGEQQGFLDLLLEATPIAVVVFDFDGRISLCNASAAKLLALDPASGQRLPGMPHPLTAQLDALALGESKLLADGSGRRFRAQRGQFHDRGFARHFLLIEELTVELERSERAAYEKLIRVLAHEVNNTVAATGSVLESLLYYRSQLAERDSEDFSTAIDAVRRRNGSLGEFIERFTQVVKMPEPVLRPTALVPMLDDILWLYREQCKSRSIGLGWSHQDQVPALPIDRQLMEQALLNIVKNAIEAAEGGEGPAHVRLALTREPDAVRLSVIDSGNRLGQTDPHALFTPFYTTKPGGQGIGLTLVREVLNRHGLRYQLAPTGDGETRFDIWFAL